MEGWETIRTDNLESNGCESLFDLQNDPSAYRNVANESDYASVLADHRLQLLHRLIEMERPLPAIWPY